MPISFMNLSITLGEEPVVNVIYCEQLRVDKYDHISAINVFGVKSVAFLFTLIFTSLDSYLMFSIRVSF